MNSEIVNAVEIDETTKDPQQKHDLVLASGEEITKQLLPYSDTFVQIEDDEFDEDTDDGLADEIEQSKKVGTFIPTNELTPLFLTRDGSAILAKKVIGKNNESYIVIVYAYSDGTTSAEIKIENSELHYILEGNYGKKNAQIASASWTPSVE